MTQERIFEDSRKTTTREAHAPEHLERAERAKPPEAERRVESAERLFERESQIRVRNKTFQLSATESRVAYEVGRFRAIQERDLEAYGAAGQEPQRVLRSLVRKKLVKSITFTTPGEAEETRIVVLTKLGRELAERGFGAKTQQRFYAGLVKLRELKHDTAIYRMFQEESKRVEAEQGTVYRVVLDYELKRNIFSDLERDRKEQPTRAEADLRKEVAINHQLQVVNGKIPFPDLRIEYRTARGESQHIDLELATGHYKASQRAEKVRAGFQIYTLSSNAGGNPFGEDMIREVFSR